MKAMFGEVRPWTDKDTDAPRAYSRPRNRRQKDRDQRPDDTNHAAACSVGFTAPPALATTAGNSTGLTGPSVDCAHDWVHSVESLQRDRRRVKSNRHSLGMNM